MVPPCKPVEPKSFKPLFTQRCGCRSRFGSLEFQLLATSQTVQAVLTWRKWRSLELTKGEFTGKTCWKGWETKDQALGVLKRDPESFPIVRFKKVCQLVRSELSEMQFWFCGEFECFRHVSDVNSVIAISRRQRFLISTYPITRGVFIYNTFSIYECRKGVWFSFLEGCYWINCWFPKE